MGHFFQWLFGHHHHDDPCAPDPCAPDRVPAQPVDVASTTLRCASCGTHNEPAASFCQACGVILPSTKVVTPATTNGRCASCARPYVSGSRFCQGCGEVVGRAK